MKKIILMLPVILFVRTSGYAQSVGPSTLNATGGAAAIGSSVFEWSVGEMTMVSTFTSAGIIVTQGVLQPANSTEGVPVTKELSKTLRVFPNPATDLVNLQYTSESNGTLSCRLFEMTGKEISRQNIAVTNGLTVGQVDVKPLAAATYLLKVTIVTENGASETTTFKIQKLK